MVGRRDGPDPGHPGVARRVQRAAHRLVLSREGAKLVVGRRHDDVALVRHRDRRILRDFPSSHDRLLRKLASTVMREEPGPEIVTAGSDSIADAYDSRSDVVVVADVVLSVRPQRRRAEVDQVGLVVVREKAERLIVCGSNEVLAGVRAGPRDDDVDIGTLRRERPQDRFGFRHRQSAESTAVDVDNLVAHKQSTVPEKSKKI